MLWMLTLCGPFSLLMSDMPRAWAWPFAIVAASWGFFDARRQGRQQPRALLIPIGCGQPTCDGQPMLALNVQWRGPLAFLRWRDLEGVRRHLSFWPDTLPSTLRRELRLATMRVEPARDAASVAR